MEKRAIPEEHSFRCQSFNMRSEKRDGEEERSCGVARLGLIPSRQAKDPPSVGAPHVNFLKNVKF